MARIPLGRAHILASSTIQELHQATGGAADALTPVGSLRRYAPHVSRVALFAAADRPGRERLLRAFVSLPRVESVRARTASAATIATDRGEVTLHVADVAVAGAALAWLTGSVAHVHRLAALAGARGLTFADARLLDAAGEEVACASETELYALLGLPFITPELRHGEDEIDAALEGRLPALVSDVHIRGDLHMHSLWSDGRDTVDAMVAAAGNLGYEYVAMTDHSQRAWASRTLAPADVAAQRLEIEDVRRRHPNVRVLHGVEVDILHDGTLDFPDDLLAGFDIVLASLHDDAGHDGAALTERYLAAMRSPYVDVITHPLNRSPGVSSGYDLDLDRVFAAAAETGTAMEIDGAPGHLDMDGAIARRAAAAGVTLVIDSDCHRAELLRRQMRFGIGTARRGWVEPRHVLNTRGVDEVLAFVARKRARG